MKDQPDRIRAAIAGGLKSTLDAHGPITPNLITSATKRIFGLVMAEIRKDASNACSVCGAIIPYPEENCPDHFEDCPRCLGLGTVRLWDGSIIDCTACLGSGVKSQDEIHRNTRTGSEGSPSK